jgi:hypothetical protein
VVVPVVDTVFVTVWVTVVTCVLVTVSVAVAVAVPVDVAVAVAVAVATATDSLFSRPSISFCEAAWSFGGTLDPHPTARTVIKVAAARDSVFISSLSVS